MKWLFAPIVLALMFVGPDHTKAMTDKDAAKSNDQNGVEEEVRDVIEDAVLGDDDDDEDRGKSAKSGKGKQHANKGKGKNKGPGKGKGKGKNKDKANKDRDDDDDYDDDDDESDGRGRGLPDIIFGEDEKKKIGEYYSKNRVNVDVLPPGIAKNLERGKPLPPGIAAKDIPYDLRSQFPFLDGYKSVITGDDVVLVDESTNVVVDILKDILNR